MHFTQTCFILSHRNQGSQRLVHKRLKNLSHSSSSVGFFNCYEKDRIMQNRIYPFSIKNKCTSATKIIQHFLMQYCQQKITPFKHVSPHQSHPSLASSSSSKSSSKRVSSVSSFYLFFPLSLSPPKNGHAPLHTHTPNPHSMTLRMLHDNDTPRSTAPPP